MQVHFVVLGILGVFQLGCQAQVQPLSQEQWQLVVQKFISSSCPRMQNDQQATQKLVHDIQEFFMYGQQALVTVQQDVHRFCRSNVPVLKAKFSTITVDVDTCLDEETRYFSTFANSSFRGIMDFLCNNNARNIEELISPASQVCSMTWQLPSTNADFKHCLEDVLPKNGKVKNKENMCAALSASKECVGKMLDRHCPTFDAAPRLNEEFFDAITQPCGASPLTVSAALILLLGVLSKMLS